MTIRQDIPTSATTARLASMSSMLAFCLLAVGMTVAASAQTRTVRVELTPLEETANLAWTELATEGSEDVRSPRLPDARSVSYHYDAQSDQLWFRLGLQEAPREDFFGINLAIDSDSDQSNGLNWWGINQGFRFDRLVTVYVNQAGGAYQGSVGIGDVAGIMQGRMDNLAYGNIRISLDRAGKAILIGMKGRDLDDDLSMNLIATVGSSMIPNDDLPDTGKLELVLGKNTKADLTE